MPWLPANDYKSSIQPLDFYSEAGPMQEFESILNMWRQSWQNPAMRHAMLIHFPVVLAFLLVPLGLLTSVWAGTFRKTLIIFCFIIGLATAGTAWLAKDTGSKAHLALGTGLATRVGKDIPKKASYDDRWKCSSA